MKLHSSGPRLGSRCVTFASVLFLSASAYAADVDGKLLLKSLSMEPQSEAGADYYWEVENGIKPVDEPSIDARRRLAVVLLGKGESTQGEQVEVELSGGSLSPSTLAIRKGTTLRIENRDEIAHELYAAGLNGFSAEATSPRAMRTIHLTQVGDWAIRDNLAPHLRAHLHVLPNLIAVADMQADGSFSLSDVPAGSYTLKVLRGPKELASQAVEVAQDARKLSLDPLALAGPDTPGSD